MTKKVLVVVDMQNDFITGSLGTAEARGIVKKVKQKLQKAQKEKADILFTRDTHNANYLETQEGKQLPILHCIRYTPGWEIEKSLQMASAQVFDKNTFASLDLVHHILANGYTEVELVGVCTDICVISNALLIKAYLPEVTVKVDSSCCAGTTPEQHQNALSVMRQCQVVIL